MEIELKCECGNDSFNITKINSCEDCNNNWFYDAENEEYTHDEEKSTGAGLRVQCEEQGYCNVGDNCNNGCHLYICAKCKVIVDHISITDN